MFVCTSDGVPVVPSRTILRLFSRFRSRVREILGSSGNRSTEKNLKQSTQEKRRKKKKKKKKTTRHEASNQERQEVRKDEER